MQNKKAPNEARVFDALKKTAAPKILEYLSNLFLSSKVPEKIMPKEKRSKAYFHELMSRLELNSAALSNSLHELSYFRLIQGGKKDGYEITDLGLFVYPFLKIIRTISKPERQTIYFNEMTDETSWITHANYLISRIKPKGELLITTRWFDSFTKYKEQIDPTLKEARKKNANIKIIGDVEFPENLKKYIESSYQAK
ncbi:MAG: hypothetical protein QXP36_14745, partial [Conexivisphaerales archaeon]